MTRVRATIFRIAVVAGILMAGACSGSSPDPEPAPAPVPAAPAPSPAPSPVAANEPADFVVVNGERLEVTPMQAVVVILGQGAAIEIVEEDMKNANQTLRRDDDFVMALQNPIPQVKDAPNATEIISFVPIGAEALSRQQLVRAGRRLETQAEDKNYSVETAVAVDVVGRELRLVYTDQAIVRFADGVSRASVEEALQPWSVRIVAAPPPGRPTNAYILELEPTSPIDAITLSAQLGERADVKYAHPNYIEFDAEPSLPKDPQLGDQWHHDNPGTPGVNDADIDTTLAWALEQGDDIVVAVIDDGFQLNHQDLEPTLWENTPEVTGTAGVDDDSNGYVDDTQGWNFDGCGTSFFLGCGDNNPGWRDIHTDDHGTLTAGVALARTNTMGVAGVCPNCTLLPIRRPLVLNHAAKAETFWYARGEKARVINASFSHQNPNHVVHDYMREAVAAAAQNAVIVWSAGNKPTSDYCNASYPTLPDVVAVSGSDASDLRGPYAFGACVDLLAPGHNVLTTQLAYQPDHYVAFSGTSAAAPVVSGTAALVIAAQPSLTPQQVARVLFDTTDRIEPNSAAYDAFTGRSAPASGPPTHGFGRVNADQAVRLVAPPNATEPAASGRGGHDLFLRDNDLDWGNDGDQPSHVRFDNGRTIAPTGTSPDIKIDAAPFYGTPTATTFDTVADEPLASNIADYRFHVRVRNRGPQPVANAEVRVIVGSENCPALSKGLWENWPDLDDIDLPWSVASCEAGGDACTIPSVGHSGASVANTAEDGSAVVTFAFTPPPELANTGFCVFAVAEAATDPLPLAVLSTTVNDVSPYFNNITHRRVPAGGANTAPDEDANTVVDAEEVAQGTDLNDPNVPPMEVATPETTDESNTDTPSPICATLPWVVGSSWLIAALVARRARRHADRAGSGPTA